MKVGDRVMYTAYWLEAPLPGTIIGTGEKNGKVVYDVKLEGIELEVEIDCIDPSTRWGYEDQFSLL
jgi:hypothetical protein